MRGNMHAGDSFAISHVRNSDDFIDVSTLLDDEIYIKKETGNLYGVGASKPIDPGKYFAVCIICEIDPSEEIVEAI